MAPHSDSSPRWHNRCARIHILGSKLRLGFRRSWDKDPEEGLFKKNRSGAELVGSQPKKGERRSGCSPLSVHGGGAENRTPVQSSPLTGVSRLSHQFCLGRRTPDDSRSTSQLVQSFPRAYQLRPLEHLPRMTRPRRREQSPVQRLLSN